MDQNEINDNVARGAALLDEKRPGWVDDVDLGRLRMVSGVDCILGQLYQGYSTGAAVLWSCWADRPCCAPEAITHGFQFPEDGDDMHGGPWELLDAAWEARITALRDEYVQSLLADGWQLSRDSLTMISPATGRETPASHPKAVSAIGETIEALSA